MGPCNCAHQNNNYEGLIAEFFDKMKIVDIKTEEIKDLLLSSITENLMAKSDFIFKTKFLPFLETTSSNEKFIKVTNEFWEIAYNSLIQNHDYLCLTLLIISKGDIEVKVKAIYEILSKFGSKEIRKDGDKANPTYLIKNDSLRQFLSFYVFFLSIFTIGSVAKLSSDEEEFRHTLEHIYHADYRNILVGYCLEHYQTEINLREFFFLNLPDISHKKIRERLFSVYSNYFSQSTRPKILK